MSATVSPRPGGTAALKARREAYQTAEYAPVSISQARDMLDAGYPKGAAQEAGATVQALRANPEALRIAELRLPGIAKQAEQIHQQAVREAPDQVTIRRMSGWRQEAGMETRVVIGQSDRGWHHSVSVSTPGSDRSTEWSGPFPTAKAAEGAGRGYQSRLHGDERHSQSVTPTPRGEHAANLNEAAHLRRASNTQRDPRDAEAFKAQAFEKLSSAVNVRLSSGMADGGRPGVALARQAQRSQGQGQKISRGMER